MITDDMMRERLARTKPYSRSFFCESSARCPTEAPCAASAFSKQRSIGGRKHRSHGGMERRAHEAG